MKKFIAVIIIIAAFAAAGFFGYDYFQEKKMTAPSQWKAIGTSEFIVNILENMESSSDLYSVSTGEEQVAFYSNSKAAFSVAKLSILIMHQ